MVNRDQAEDVLEDVLLSSTPLVAVAHGWKVKLYLLEPEGYYTHTIPFLLAHSLNLSLKVHGEI